VEWGAEWTEEGGMSKEGQTEEGGTLKEGQTEEGRSARGLSSVTGAWIGRLHWSAMLG